jgi:hypothetical protein
MRMTTSAACVKHNDRYRRVDVVVKGVTTTVADAIVWRMDEGYLDIARYGDNVSTVLIELERIQAVAIDDEDESLVVVMR